MRWSWLQAIGVNGASRPWHRERFDIAGFFIANRLLPLGAEFAGFKRDELEMWAFYLVWLAAFGHAAWRRAGVSGVALKAWREQCWLIAVLSGGAAALNAVTTGHHLGYTLLHGSAAVAGMDLVLLAAAALAAALAVRLGHASRRSSGQRTAVHPSGSGG